MRVSANGEYDWRKSFMTCPDVRLDGRKLAGCIEADDVAGYIVRAKRDAAGKLVHDGKTIATEKLTGRVEIIGVQK